jgi:hypothetical protein
MPNKLDIMKSSADVVEVKIFTPTNEGGIRAWQHNRILGIIPRLGSSPPSLKSDKWPTTLVANTRVRYANLITAVSDSRISLAGTPRPCIFMGLIR